MPIPLLQLLHEGIEVRPWLERLLVGPDLLAVVRELTAIHGNAPATDPSYMAERRTEILEHGLASLTEKEVQALFRAPSLLLRLQEWVLLNGGPYWDGVLTGSATQQPVSSARPRSLRLFSLLSHLGAAVAAAALVWFLLGTRSPNQPRNSNIEIVTAPADAVLASLAEQLDRKWSALRSGPDLGANLLALEHQCAVLAAASLPQFSEHARAALRGDLAALQSEIEEQRRILMQGGSAWRVRTAVESRVNALLATRWRDPEDLPDSQRDPDNLPPLDVF